MTEELKPKRGRVSTEEIAKMAATAPQVSPLREPPLMEEDPGQMAYLGQIADIFQDDITDESYATLIAASRGTKGLHAKLAEVMLEVGRIPKNGTAPAAMGGYAFVQVGDAADPIRKALAVRGVTMLPETVDVTDLQLEGGRNKNMTTMTVKTVWRLTDGESGESTTIESLGTGADSGDKFSPKAQTNAMKYALLMGFLLSTGDDPEAANLEEAPSGPIITSSSVPGIRQGGRQNQVTQAQIDTIRKIAADTGQSADELITIIGLAIVGDTTDTQKEFLGEWSGTGEEADKRRDLMVFLGGLSFSQAGSVIQALSGT